MLSNPTETRYFVATRLPWNGWEIKVGPLKFLYEQHLHRLDIRFGRWWLLSYFYTPVVRSIGSYVCKRLNIYDK